MTTHVLIVNADTFKQHLEYMFIGTGNGKPFQFNDGAVDTEGLHHSSEKVHAGMVADCSRMRAGDFIIFYLQQSGGPGGFFGLFRVRNAEGSSFPAFIDNRNDSKYPELTKALQFRAFIEPYAVYAKGVTEWEALDDIKHIQSPYQMLWSLIYRKLKGNRGNTMITLYESERLISLIQAKNMEQVLHSETGFTYDSKINEIVVGERKTYDTTGCIKLSVTERLRELYIGRRAHETHLQAFITGNIGTGSCPSLDQSVLASSQERINWLGNEVSCGVGMQRMDILLSTETSGQILNSLYVVELKCVPINASHILQMNRYIDWLTQYYTSNRKSVIRPVLITRGDEHSKVLPNEVIAEKENFDKQYMGKINYQPLTIINYRYIGSDIVFSKV